MFALWTLPPPPPRLALDSKIPAIQRNKNILIATVQVASLKMSGLHAPSVPMALRHDAAASLDDSAKAIVLVPQEEINPRWRITNLALPSLRSPGTQQLQREQQRINRDVACAAVATLSRRTARAAAPGSRRLRAENPIGIPVAMTRRKVPISAERKTERAQLEIGHPPSPSSNDDLDD